MRRPEEAAGGGEGCRCSRHHRRVRDTQYSHVCLKRHVSGATQATLGCHLLPDALDATFLQENGVSNTARHMRNSRP